MASCLGLYIEEHLIKYAKVSKEKETIKVETFGVKFYDKIDEAINQIVQETYSQKTPISINLSDEMYTYFEMYALLGKNDLQKAIKTEFESYCAEKSYNPNVFESRFAVVESRMEKERLRVIHIAENKIELNRRTQQIEGYRLANISPISMAIPNLINVNKNDNYLIVNIEDKTTITTVLNNKIYNVEQLDEGSANILSKINIKENSYSKSYEICKETTIYTSEGKELQEEQQTYLEDIMPTLYEIVGKVRKTINANSTEKISKVYITGTASLVNNIDLYFEEYLADIECEVLKPYFIEKTKDISIKDYIEVNSAISLALMGVGDGIQGMNFKKGAVSDKLPDWLRVDVKGKAKKGQGGLFTWDFGQKIDKTETGLIRVAVGLLLLIFIYGGASVGISKLMDEKGEEADASITSTKKQISIANADNQKIKSKTNIYISAIDNIKELDERYQDRNKTRNAIPNLLNQIMAITPQNVQITSIENTFGKKIVINARSNKYDQLGYLISALKAEGILNNVISSSTTKEGNDVSIKIEGELWI